MHVDDVAGRRQTIRESVEKTRDLLHGVVEIDVDRVPIRGTGQM